MMEFILLAQRTTQEFRCSTVLGLVEAEEAGVIVDNLLIS
jgi:hypothetical protein